MLRDGWGLDVADLVLVDGGADAAAWGVQATTADGRRWFVKLKLADIVSPAAILVPRLLRERGLAEVVASIAPRSGTATPAIGPWAVLVSPWVDGRLVLRTGMSDDGWRRLGVFAARLHSVDLPARLRRLVPVETFRSASMDSARAMDRLVGADVTSDDLLSNGVVRRWITERPTIRHLIARADELTPAVRERAAGREPFVLCHADLHTGNVLVRPDGTLSVVDWDELLLAPRERDLMFVRGSTVADIVTEAQADAFEAGYGPASVDPLLIAWYRIDWALQDVAGYAREILDDPGRDAHARARAAERFESQFGPGGNVVSALAAEAVLATT